MYDQMSLALSSIFWLLWSPLLTRNGGNLTEGDSRNLLVLDLQGINSKLDGLMKERFAEQLQLSLKRVHVGCRRH